MKQREIAKIHGITESMVSYLLSGDRTTDRWELARDLAKYSNKKAITFIHPKHQELFRRAYPKIFR